MRMTSLFGAALVLILATPAFAQVYVWTGELPTNWQGQLTPPNDGTANLLFGDSLYPYVTVTPSLNSVNTLTLANGNNITFRSGSSLTLSLTSGILSADEIPGTLDFGANINLGISSAAVFSAGENIVYVRGQVTGNSSLALLGGAAGDGTFIFSNTGAGNTYTGSTVLGNGTSTVAFAFWNTSPFGTGTVTIMNGATLIGHGTETVSNALMLDAAGSSNPIGLKSWDAPLTFSGPVTLLNNVTLNPKPSQTFIPAPSSDGSVTLPGPVLRNPIVFSGDLSESGGAHSVGVFGQGILMLTGAANSYTGGTTVGGAAGTGSLVFGAGSIPASGSLTLTAGSYVGTTDTSSAFTTLLSHVAAGSPGSFGIDTVPGNATATYALPIDLSTATNPNLTNANVQIGTATSAILTGTITPESSAAFQFGGGGGTLYVNTPLANGVATNVVLSGHGSPNPLTVYLQGANTYIGSTTVNDGILIFDGASALPGSTTLKAAGGGGSNAGDSYVGYTDNVTGMTPAAFLAMFDKANTWGVIGFDSKVPTTPVVIGGNIDLTGFNDGTAIGTATEAILTGTLTPSSVTNSYQAANTLRFTAAKTGILTVDSVISGAVSVALGSSDSSQGFASGTVIMNAPNSYTGGTTLNGGGLDGLTLGIGNNAALGSGPLTIANNHGGGLVGIQTTAGSVNLPNNIVIQDTGATGATQLNLTGTNSFTLSGNLSGDGSSSIVLYNASPLTVTLSGNNSAYAGTFGVYNGTLKFAADTAAGSASATVDFEGSGATVDFTGAVAPTLERLKGAVGSLVLGSGTALTLDATQDTSNDGSSFGGVISGGGSLIITNTSSSNSSTAILYGTNTYTGGTTVTQNGLLVLANNQGAGTGTVTVNTSSNGALGLDSGVTFTNPLVFTSGNLAGYGTFNPSALGLAGTVTIGTNQGVVPGFPVSNNKVVTGTLSFAGNMVFNDGGSFYWTLQDNSRPDGISQLDIAGNLTINATTNGFGLELLSYDATGAQNNAANFNVSAPYSWVILTTGGTISNFNANDFVISTSGFENGSFPSSHFTLTENAGDNQLILNFTPVPEPSTYALLATGLGLVGVAAFRMRRA